MMHMSVPVFPPANVQAATAAVVQAVEESGFGRSYQQGHPQLVSESSDITQKVLAVAHSERQQQFIKAGYVSNEFSNASIENAALRAQHAVQRSAEMLGPAATSSEIIRLASHDPTALAQQLAHSQQQQQQLQPQFAQSVVDYNQVVAEQMGMLSHPHPINNTGMPPKSVMVPPNGNVMLSNGMPPNSF